MQRLENKKLIIAILCAVLLLMFVCNCLTEEVADDWSYHFSFATGEPITGLGDIFTSMGAHYDSTNGRLVAHFFVQLFEVLPKPVFNLVNTGMFTLMLVLCYYIAADRKYNALLLVSIFAAIWIFTPAFGQVYLWLDGSCNYLWSVCFGLLYILPFVTDWMYDKTLRKWWMKVLFIPFALLTGAFSENGSAAFIAVAVLLQLAIMVWQKKKRIWGILSVPAAMVGYVLMVMAPGTAKNKSADFAWMTIRKNFIGALEMYRLLEILLIAFCVFAVLALLTKIGKKKVVLAVVLVIGSLIANFIMAAAAYYEQRNMITSTVLLVAADGILMQHLLYTQYKPLLACVAAVALLYCGYFVCLGVNDIYQTGIQYRANEAYVQECRAEGDFYIELMILPAETKYAAGHGLAYLSTQSWRDWPNCMMAKYYGVEQIIGYYAPEELP